MPPSLHESHEVLMSEAASLHARCVLVLEVELFHLVRHRRARGGKSHRRLPRDPLAPG